MSSFLNFTIFHYHFPNNLEKCTRPYFSFFSIKKTDDQFCRQLLDNQKIVNVPIFLAVEILPRLEIFDTKYSSNNYECKISNGVYQQPSPRPVGTLARLFIPLSVVTKNLPSSRAAQIQYRGPCGVLKAQ